jgi:hypothetical protein
MYKILRTPVIFKILLSTSQKKCVSIESTKTLKLFREVINNHTVDHTKSINNLCCETKFPNVTAVNYIIFKY